MGWSRLGSVGPGFEINRYAPDEQTPSDNPKKHPQQVQLKPRLPGHGHQLVPKRFHQSATPIDEACAVTLCSGLLRPGNRPLFQPRHFSPAGGRFPGFLEKNCVCQVHPGISRPFQFVHNPRGKVIRSRRRRTHSG